MASEPHDTIAWMHKEINRLTREAAKREEILKSTRDAMQVMRDEIARLTRERDEAVARANHDSCLAAVEMLEARVRQVESERDEARAEVQFLQRRAARLHVLAHERRARLAEVQADLARARAEIDRLHATLTHVTIYDPNAYTSHLDTEAQQAAWDRAVAWFEASPDWTRTHTVEGPRGRYSLYTHSKGYDVQVLETAAFSDSHRRLADVLRAVPEARAEILGFAWEREQRGESDAS